MNEKELKTWSRATFLAQNELATGDYGDATRHYIDALNVALQLRESTWKD